MRTLEGHRVNPANDVLTVQVTDAPGSGGANHRYEISGFNTATNPSAEEGGFRASYCAQIILFQNGPIAEAGVNGLTQEVLLAICIDRLECFQAGPFRCDENALALNYLKMAQETLLNRTRARMARGVEGTYEK